MAATHRSFAAIVVAMMVAAAFTGCSVVVSTAGLSGGAPSGGDASSSPDAAVALDDAGARLPTSCRALHASSPDAGSNVYMLAGPDGGVLDAYCDMESFGGGWTRVTPSMIVEDKAVQEYAPGGPSMVAVARGTEVQGGVTFSLEVKAINCGASAAGKAPGHYFLVGELDGWTQIMASYLFAESTSCWHIFGDPNGKDTNVQPFDLGQDLIGPELNMSRSKAGAAIPFDGRLTACNQNADNFWSTPYENDPKSARVVLRRFAQDHPAGLAIVTDCGLATWKVYDIHVR